MPFFVASGAERLDDEPLGCAQPRQLGVELGKRGDGGVLVECGVQPFPALSHPFGERELANRQLVAPVASRYRSRGDDSASDAENASTRNPEDPAMEPADRERRA